MLNGRVARCSILLMCIIWQLDASAPRFSEDWYGFRVEDGLMQYDEVGSCPTTIPPSLLQLLYSVGIRSGNDNNVFTFNRVLDYGSNTVLGYLQVAPNMKLNKTLQASYELIVTVSIGSLVGSATISIGVGSGATTMVPMFLMTMFTIGVIRINFLSSR